MVWEQSEPECVLHTEAVTDKRWKRRSATTVRVGPKFREAKLKRDSFPTTKNFRVPIM